jgi:large subunit ribosomal protein L25
VYKPDITVLGMMDMMPGAIHVDVSDMKLGDAITLNNFDLDKQLKVSENEDTVYGMIINQPINTTAETETK